MCVSQKPGLRAVARCCLLLFGGAVAERACGNGENFISCFSINFYVSRAARVVSSGGHTGECKDPSHLWLNNGTTLELYRRYKSPNVLDQFYALGTPLYPVTRRNAKGVILPLSLSLLSSVFFPFCHFPSLLSVLFHGGTCTGVCNIPVYCAPIVVENKAIRRVEPPAWSKKLKFDRSANAAKLSVLVKQERESGGGREKKRERRGRGRRTPAIFERRITREARRKTRRTFGIISFRSRGAI